MILRAIMQKFPDQCYFFDFSVSQPAKDSFNYLSTKGIARQTYLTKCLEKNQERKYSSHKRNRQDKTTL